MFSYLKNPKLTHFNLHKSALILILALSLIYRLVTLDYPLLNSESHRDYLVARHIVKYHELPQTGPCCAFSSSFGNLRETPIYFYFLALFVAIKENIIFLQAVNLFLQLIPIVAIYVIASKFYGKTVALISTILYSFSLEAFKQATFVWQPHIMQVFLYLAYVSLLFSYLKKSYLGVLAGIFFFIFASSLHPPALGIAPAFLLVVLLILANQKRPPYFYFLAATFAAVLTLVLYAPLIFYLSEGQNNQSYLRLLTSPGTFLNLNPYKILGNFWDSATILFKSLATPFEKTLKLWDWLLIFPPLIFAALYLKNHDHLKKEQKLPLLVTTFAIVQFLAITSLLKATIWYFYLVPIFGFFIITIALVIDQLKYPLKFAGYLWIALMLINFFSFYQITTPLKNATATDLATEAIISQVQTIQKKELYSEPDFFQIKVYGAGIESPQTADLVFWVPLEEKLDKRFVKITDIANSYRIINSDKYLFLVCHSHLYKIELQNECLGPFSNDFQSYTILENIYKNDPFSIFLTKKASD